MRILAQITSEISSLLRCLKAYLSQKFYEHQSTSMGVDHGGDRGRVSQNLDWRRLMQLPSPRFWH